MTPEEVRATAEQLLRAHEKVASMEYAQPFAADERRDLARLLHTGAGWSQTRIGRHLGISRGRVHQILHGNPRYVRKPAETTQEVTNS